VVIAAVKLQEPASAVLTPDRGDGKSFNLSFSDSFEDADWYISDFTLSVTFFSGRLGSRKCSPPSAKYFARIESQAG